MSGKNIYINRIFFGAILIASATGCLPVRHNASNSLPPNSPTYPSFLMLSDIHLDSNSDSTKYGGDTGLGLWRCFLNKADSVLASPHPPRFVVYTGDLPAHYTCGTSCYLAPGQRTTHNKDLTMILTGLRNLVKKYHTPLFYLPGNNDALAGNYYSFADEFQQTALSLVPDSTNPYPAVNIIPGNTKAPCMVSNPQPKMGYYAVKPVDGLRLICLNTVIYSAKFTPVDGTTQEADGDMQMQWLAGQMADAKAQNEKVYIAMHIPPGLDAYSNKGMWVKLPGQKQSWLNSFLTLMDNYQNTVAGILYGHTHMDEVRRIYDSTGMRITQVAISCPGVTPQHNNNPGFKTVDYDPGTKQLMNFTTYYTKPGASSWGNNQYNFDSSFTSPANRSIYHQLRKMQLKELSTHMSSIYTVKNGDPAYDIQRAIEVKWGQ